MVLLALAVLRGQTFDLVIANGRVLDGQLVRGVKPGRPIPVAVAPR